MKPDFQRRIQRYGWDKASGYYEQYWRRQLKPAQNKLIEMADLQPGQKVLDLACGTGLVTFPAAVAVEPTGTVTAIDLSEGMLDIARQEAKERGIRNVSFIHMDAEKLNLPENAFDIALCSLGLMYVPDPNKAIQEIFRVLTPGGRAVLLVWGERSQCGWAEIFPIVDRRVQSDVCPLFFQLGTRPILRQAFEDTGFAEVTTERFKAVLHFDTEEEACGAAFLGGAVALAYRKFDDYVKEEVHAEYLASIEAYRSRQGYEVPGEFVIAMGYKPH